MVNQEQVGVEEQETSHPAFSRLSILRTIWKRKVRITLAWILFSSVAVAVVRMLPPVYMAETVVLIDSQKIPEKFVSATVADDTEERIASIRQQLLSGAELKKVIAEFGLYKEESKTHFEEEILDVMRKDIRIALESAMPSASGGSSRNTKRPGAFRIGYEGRNPGLVMQVANRLTDLCVEQNVKTREGQAAGTSEFLDAQLRDSKKRLDEMEAAVSTYKLEHNGELPQQENALSGRLARLQIELEANRDAINRAQQSKIMLESSVIAMESNLTAQSRAWDQATQQRDEATGAPIVPGQPAADSRTKTIEALETQLELQRARLAETNPTIGQLRTAIANLKHAEALRVAREAAEPPLVDGTRSKRTPAQILREPPEFARTREQLAAAKAQISATETEVENRQKEQQRILRDLDANQRRVEHLPVREQEMAQITRDYEMSKENYKSLLDKKMAAEMSLNMERRQQSERFVVLDRAQLPEKPVKPKRPVLYAGGLAVSLLLGIAIGFAAELRQNVFLGEWELDSGTPVLARLPHIEVGVKVEQAKAKPRGWFTRRKPLTNATVL